MSRFACNVIAHVPVSSPFCLFSCGGSQLTPEEKKNLNSVIGKLYMPEEKKCIEKYFNAMEEKRKFQELFLSLLECLKVNEKKVLQTYLILIRVF